MMKLTVAKLREMCKDKGIRGYSTKKKQELIELLDGNLPTNIKSSPKIKGKLETEVKPNKKGKLETEVLGKEFEMAVCLYYGIDYDGGFKYDINKARELSKRLGPLKDLFAPTCQHTAGKRGVHDFTYYNSGLTRHLSVKTNKNLQQKVCPQKIGQPSEKTFRENFGLTEDENIKEYIEANTASMLKKYWNCTYNVPVLYYNEQRDKICFIKELNPPDFEQENITFTQTGKDWKSTTVKYKGKRIGEFQEHNNRNCIKFRWFQNNLEFKDVIEF